MLPDSIRPLAVEIPFILYLFRQFLFLECLPLRATDMLLLRAIHHSNLLSEQIPIRVSPTPADACLVSYPSFQSTYSPRHATSLHHISFNSSRRVDSNELLPNPIQPLVVELTSFLTLATPEPPTQNNAYRELESARVMPPLEPYTIQFVSTSGFK